MTENKNVEQEAAVDTVSGDAQTEEISVAEQKRLETERAYDTLSLGEINRRKEYLKRMNPGLDNFNMHDVVHYEKYVGDETIRREGLVKRNKKKRKIKEQGVPAILLVATIGFAYYFFFFLDKALW